MWSRVKYSASTCLIHIIESTRIKNEKNPVFFFRLFLILFFFLCGFSQKKKVTYIPISYTKKKKKKRFFFLTFILFDLFRGRAWFMLHLLLQMIIPFVMFILRCHNLYFKSIILDAFLHLHLQEMNSECFFCRKF